MFLLIKMFLNPHIIYESCRGLLQLHTSYVLQKKKQCAHDLDELKLNCIFRMIIYEYGA